MSNQNMVRTTTNPRYIDRFGYKHHAGDAPDTPESHTLLLVPASLNQISNNEEWLGFCSCCEWAGGALVLDFEGKEEALSAIRKEHIEHKNRQAHLVKIAKIVDPDAWSPTVFHILPSRKVKQQRALRVATQIDDQYRKITKDLVYPIPLNTFENCFEFLSGKI